MLPLVIYLSGFSGKKNKKKRKVKSVRRPQSSRKSVLKIYCCLFVYCNHSCEMMGCSVINCRDKLMGMNINSGLAFTLQVKCLKKNSSLFGQKW